MEPPFELFYKNIPIATISTLNYETPWLMGKATFKSPDLKIKLARAWDYINNDNDPDEILSVEDENAIDQKTLERLGINDDIVNMICGDEWSLKLTTGEVTKIHSPIFDDSDYIEWRQ